MKTLDSHSLHNGIDDLLKKIKTQIDQLKEIENAIENFLELDDSFNGKGGKAIRSFYSDWHVPILSFYSYTLKNYERILTNLKKASEELESDANGFISQGFLDTDLTNGINKAKTVTTQLVDEANNTINSVNDIVFVQGLNDQQFHNNIQRATTVITKTIDDLISFDSNQTKELDTVAQDIQLMKNYISEIQGMFKSGELSVTNYNADQLREKLDFKKLESALFEKKIMAFGDAVTAPFDFMNGELSKSDTILAGYQAAVAIGTFRVAKKLEVHYFGKKPPTLWQKLRGKYEFSVKMDPSWTSKGKHSNSLAKWLIDFSRAPIPSNPVMKSLQKFVKSYKSPSHLYKHLSGFPKNVDRISGNEFIKGTKERMAIGTKEVLGKTVTNSGLAKVGRRIPVVGTGISVLANAGEFFSHENKDKSFSEKFGRVWGGVVADAASIAVGAKLGATIGSVGGPVGIVIGGALGAFAGGIASSKIGDAAKDLGGKIGKEVGKFAGEIGSAITDAGGKLKKSIGSWFN
jgi:toxin YxiD